MAISKDKKKDIIASLRKSVADQKAMVLVGITGLKVKDMSDLRKKLKSVGAKIQVAKKTLASLVLKESSIDFDKSSFKEEVAFIFGFDDEVSAAKEVYQFSKANENIKILGGVFENKFKEKEEMTVLAQLPSRSELLAKLTGSLASPMSGLANVLQGNIKGFVRVLSQIKTQNV